MSILIKPRSNISYGVYQRITPENAAQYADAVDLFMVATGINHDGDFYNIDPERLKRLMDLTQT